MINVLIYIVAFVIAISVLIAVHEFGHFWVARRCGVKVLRFSIGFGKPLWRWIVGRDRTEIVVAAIPLGGYVKMLDETEGEVPPAEAHRAFNRQPIWKRVLVVVAGPAFNFLFAVLIYWAVYMVGIDALRPVVGKVVAGSIAEQGGFQKGDEILAVDGDKVQVWGQRRLYILRRALDRDVVNVEVRDPKGDIRLRTLDMRHLSASSVDATLMERGIGLYGYAPPVLPVIGGLEEGPAMSAGLEVDDRIVRIAGLPVDAWEDVVKGISARPGQATTVTVERAGRRLTVEVVPKAVKKGDTTVGRINIYPKIGTLPPEMHARLQFGPVGALSEALENTWSMSALTLGMLYHMVTLEVSSKNISGPITIAQYAGQTARIGAIQFMMFLAVISISLGVLNLLPVPILDGGHVMYYVVEAIKGGPLSERAMLVGQQIGIALLGGLMVLAFYNDLTRIFN